MEKDNMYTLKRMLTFLMIVIMIGSLTGCGETVPDLTKEQETAISEYAVELITKHSKESDGRKQLLDEEMEDTFFEEGHFQEWNLFEHIFPIDLIIWGFFQEMEFFSALFSYRPNFPGFLS